MSVFLNNVLNALSAGWLYLKSEIDSLYWLKAFSVENIDFKGRKMLQTFSYDSFSTVCENFF